MHREAKVPCYQNFSIFRFFILFQNVCAQEARLSYFVMPFSFLWLSCSSETSKAFIRMYGGRKIEKKKEGKK